MGRNNNEMSQHYSLGVIMSNSDAMRWGGNDDGMMGTGDQMSGDGRQGRPHMTGFTNIDWRTSTDNKDIAKVNEFTGHMVTPDAFFRNVFNGVQVITLVFG